MQFGQTAALPASDGEGELTREEYRRIRAQLRFTPSLLPTLGILVLDLALLVGAVALIRGGDTASFLLSQVLLAIVFFNAFAVLHECGHGSATDRPWLNTVLGHLASTFCFIPYYPWKYIHQKHHTWTGDIERDPVLKSLRNFRERGVPWIVRAAWWTWIPLGAFLQHLVYLTYPLAMWRQGEMTRGKLVRVLGSIAWLPASYAGLAVLAPELVRPANFAPAVLLFLVAEELVNIPHHVDRSTFHGKLPLWEQYRATRSCYYPRGVSELLVLNFNFHIEHHLFPDLPWYRLRGAREILRSALGRRYQEAVGIAWNVENRKRDLQRIVDSYDDATRVEERETPAKSAPIRS